MQYTSQNIGAVLAARYANAGTDVTAAGTGDATEVDCAYVDRQGYMSLKVVIVYRAVLASNNTLSIAANLQDDADGSGAGTDFGTAYASTVVATGDSGSGSTETGVVEMDFDISGAKRYVRLQFTPDLSDTTSPADTAELSAVYILGGSDTNPVTATVV